MGNATIPRQKAQLDLQARVMSERGLSIVGSAAVAGGEKVSVIAYANKTMHWESPMRIIPLMSTYKTCA